MSTFPVESISCSQLKAVAQDKPMISRNFFGELKRRNVYKVAVAYAVVGWLLIQIATQVFPFLEIPTWVVRLVIAVVAIGFPVALMIAWAFELTSPRNQANGGCGSRWRTAFQESRLDLRRGG